MSALLGLHHCINRESFLAASAFFGIYLGRGRPSRSQVFTLELFPGWRFPGWRRSIQNSEDPADSRLETRIGLKATIEDYFRFAGDLPADGY